MNFFLCLMLNLILETVFCISVLIIYSVWAYGLPYRAEYRENIGFVSLSKKLGIQWIRKKFEQTAVFFSTTFDFKLLFEPGATQVSRNILLKQTNTD